MLPEKSLNFLEKQMNEYGCYLSVINKIELFGWQAPTSEANNQVRLFVDDCTLIWLNDKVVEQTIEIRRLYKIKLSVAVISATALVHDFTLISRNDSDLRKINGLKYLKPFSDS
jgi:predicted nucleic acid-binding protein